MNLQPRPLPRPDAIGSQLLSVVIPTCGRPDDLQECLRRLSVSLESSSFESPTDIEVIVTDDSQDFLTKNLVEKNYPGVRWLGGPRKGPAANRNAGAALANGIWILFLDDDCLPEPELLEQYRQAVTSGNNVLVYEGKTSPCVQKTSLNQHAPINESGGLLWSCNFCIRRDFFNKLGGFDENFPSPAMEDVDLRERIIKENVDFPFLTHATVLHRWQCYKGGDFPALYAKSVIYFHNKHQRMHLLGFWCQAKRLSMVITQGLLKEGWRYAWRGAPEFMIWWLRYCISLHQAIRLHYRKA